MTLDLWCLVANAMWGFGLVMFETTAKTRIAGTEWNMGNREREPEVPPYVARAGRAVANHKENLPLFLTMVLVVQLAGKADRVSAIAAGVYVLARAAHAILYIAGVQRVRSAAFILGLLAIAAIASRMVL